MGVGHEIIELDARDGEAERRVEVPLLRSVFLWMSLFHAVSNGFIVFATSLDCRCEKNEWSCVSV